MKAKLIITTIISVLLSVLICYVFLMEENIPYYSFCEKDDITDLLGICVSCLSIVLTGFFAILAIDAYGRVKEIKDAQEKAKEELQSHLNTLKKFGNSQISFYQNVIKNIEYVSRLNKGDEIIQKYNSKWRTNTYRDLYRLGLDPLLLDEDKRIDYIKNLSVFAEKDDWDKIEDICKSSTESENVKKIAEIVLNNRNGQNEVDNNISSKSTDIHQKKKGNSWVGLFKKCRWWGSS